VLTEIENKSNIKNMKVKDIIEDQDDALPIEDDTDKYYGGDGRVHLIKNSKKKSAADEKYYYVNVKAIGRGRDHLMLTTEEYQRAVNRCNRNKEDIPKKMTIMEFFKSLIS
jgi:hypothetical protein|tara:strand:+ start:3206 stop:3538 length:333 start_codon:yes stop_codon:yes gene_type:complete